jgi:hypothetical protein
LDKRGGNREVVWPSLQADFNHLMDCERNEGTPLWTRISDNLAEIIIIHIS